MCMCYKKIINMQIVIKEKCWDAQHALSYTCNVSNINCFISHTDYNIKWKSVSAAE